MADLPTSIKALKELIQKAGLSTSDCFEKADLIARATEARARLLEAEKSSKVENSAKDSCFSIYNCRIIHSKSASLSPDAIVIVLHGYGATNNDFVVLSEVFKRKASLEEKNIVYIFPQAPTSKAGATAWWEIDVMKWMGAMSGGEQAIGQLIRQVPEGLPECRENLVKLVLQVTERYGNVPLILGGFSQGAMTSMDLALSLPKEIVPNLRCVLVLSGAPIVVEEWASKLREQKLRVFISHGTSDPVLPFMASSWLHELLKTNGAEVKYESHSGGHELGPQRILDSLSDFVAESISTT